VRDAELATEAGSDAREEVVGGEEALSNVGIDSREATPVLPLLLTVN
jgi:hypothetical protein